MKNYNKIYTVIYILLGFLVLIVLYLIYNEIIDNYKTNNQNYGSKTTYSAYFKKNGSTYLSKEKLTCEFINNQCLITMPIASREGGNVLGYHTDSNAHVALYNVNDTINLTSDMTFYVISSSTLTLTIADIGLDYLSNKNNFCTIYNEEISCKVKLPVFNKKGYELRGYSSNESSMAGFIYPNNEYELQYDTILYPIYNTMSRGRTIDVNTSFVIDNMVFDIEKGCNYKVYNEYLNYFKRIQLNAPYLFVGSKITFLNDDTFDKLWGESYVGMNYGPKSLRLFDVRCSNEVNNNYYATIVHELAHTWDFYYGNFMESDITSQTDIVNLFNKYKESNIRPFRDYSYTNINEFFADMVRYYYLKYIDPVYEFKNLDYPSDIKKTLEKYICISNNNYNDGSC